MPRVVEVSVPSARTDRLVSDLRDRPEVLGLRLQRGASLRPPGDVVTVSVANRSLHDLVRLLDKHGTGVDAASSLTSSQPLALVAPSAIRTLAHDTSEATWEEVENVLTKESGTTINTLLVMVVSGVIAAVGLATDALHLVIAAMVIAPGFEPILRVGLDFVVREGAVRRGLLQTARAYAALVLGAALAAVVLRLFGIHPLDGDGSYLSDGALVTYWTTFSWTVLVVSGSAAVAGAVLVAADRAILTSGVMIALALIPGTTLIASGLVGGDVEVAGRAALRWAIDALLVAGAALLVFAWKQRTLHGRRSHL